jgi:DNA-directed RNA polymerase sigma subunit (sigma70/sigma32)
VNILERFDALEKHVSNLLHPVQQCMKILGNSHKLEQLMDFLSKPIILDDRNIRILLNEIKEVINNLKISTESLDAIQTYGEIKYIGARLHSIEEDISKMKKEGIKRKVCIDVKMDDQPMIVFDETSSKPKTSSDKNKELQDVLSSLDYKGSKVIVLRLGLDGKKGLSFAKIAPLVGVTTSRANQIYHKMIRMLRHPKREELVRKYDHPALNEAVFGSSDD